MELSNIVLAGTLCNECDQQTKVETLLLNSHVHCGDVVVMDNIQVIIVFTSPYLSGTVGQSCRIQLIDVSRLMFSQLKAEFEIPKNKKSARNHVSLSAFDLVRFTLSLMLGKSVFKKSGKLFFNLLRNSSLLPNALASLPSVVNCRLFLPASTMTIRMFSLCSDAIIVPSSSIFAQISAEKQIFSVRLVADYDQGPITFARLVVWSDEKFKQMLCRGDTVKSLPKTNVFLGSSLWNRCFSTTRSNDVEQISIEPLLADQVQNANIIKLKVSRVNQFIREETRSKIIQEYFATERYLKEGDLVTTPSVHCKKNGFSFVVSEIVPKPRQDEPYRVHLDTSAIFEMGFICIKLPSSIQLSLAACHYGLHWPWMHFPNFPGFNNIISSLEILIDNFTNLQEKNKLLSIILSGHKGCGKKLIVTWIARLFGLNLVEIDCYDLWSESLASTEAKLLGTMKHARSNGFSLVLLKHVEVLGTTGAGAGSDARISSYLKTCLDEFNTGQSDLPQLIVIATTSKYSSLSAELILTFSEHLLFPNLDRTDRRQLLESLLSVTGSDSMYLNFDTLAMKTAGFVLADLVALVNEIIYVAAEESNFDQSVLQNNFSSVGKNQLVLTDGLVSLALRHIQKSVAKSIGAPKIPEVEWEDVGGLDVAKEAMKETIQLSLEHPELFASGMKRSGLLMYGPPGCGKTLLAKAVATECSLNFLSVKGPELLNMYVGQSEQNVREVFERARMAAPCVIFFDELDALAPNRGRSGDSGGVMDRVVSQLLAELDGISPRQEVFVIGATNRPDLIDSSLLRPGRFDKMIYVTVSRDRNVQADILKASSRKVKTDGEINFLQVLEHCPPRITGADISAIVSGAVMNVLSRKISQINFNVEDNDYFDLVVQQIDFEEASTNLVPSVSESEWNRYDNLNLDN